MAKILNCGSAPLEGSNSKAVSLALFGPSLVLSVIALTLPPDTLNRWPFLNGFVQAVSGIIPAMQDYISNSNIPEVASVFLSIAWISFPIHVLLMAVAFSRRGAYSRFEVIASESSSFGMTKLILKALAVSSLCGFGLLFLPKDPSFIGSFGMNSSRIGLAFFGSVCFFTFALSTSLTIYLLICKIGHSHE